MSKQIKIYLEYTRRHDLFLYPFLDLVNGKPLYFPIERLSEWIIFSWRPLVVPSLYQKTINTECKDYRCCQSRLTSQDDSSWSFRLRFSLCRHYPFSPDCAFLAASTWGSETTSSRTRGRLSRRRPQANHYFWSNSTVFGVLEWLVLLFGLWISTQYFSFCKYKSFGNATSEVILKDKSLQKKSVFYHRIVKSLSLTVFPVLVIDWPTSRRTFLSHNIFGW